MFRLPIVKFFSRILNRITITVVLVALQVAWLLWAFFSLTTGRVWVNAGLQLLSLFMMLYLVRKDENSAYKIGWIALMGVLPLLGGALYLSFGNKRPAKRLRSKLQAVDEAHKADLVQQPGQTDGLDASGLGMSRYLARYGRYPAWKNTAAQYFACGEAMYPQLLADLEKAEKSIFLEYFIVDEGLMWGRILEVLARKAAQGVDVRVMYDGTCEFSTLPRDYPSRLEALGIRCKDHRKILVIDGQVSFTGGVNLADEYINHIEKYGRWKDSALMLEGEGVRSMTALFLQMWSILCQPEFEQFLSDPIPAAANAKGFVVPYGDCPLDGERVGEMVYMDMLNRARKYVHIITPYLILDGELETALRFAAERGVDVHLILPGKPDKWFVYALAKTHYKALISSGVKISEWTPGFTHAKVMIMDGQEAVVGTINLDYRSLYLHFENSVLLYGGAVLDDVRRDLAEIEKESAAVTLADCRTGFFGTLYSAVLRLVAPLC